MGHVGIVEALLDAGADARDCNYFDVTPLHLAAQAGSPEIVAVLLAAGANVNARHAGGMAPLHFATSPEVVAALASAGAAVDPRTRDGWTPLHWAALLPGSDQRLVAALIEAGADVDAMGEDGETPLHLATDAGEASLVALLLEAGADVSACDEYGQSLVHLAICSEVPGEQSALKALVEAGADVDALQAVIDIEAPEDEIWWTPLHRAVTIGDPDIVSLLLKSGADASVRDSNGRLAWDIARKRGERDDDFLYSDVYWQLHKATVVATRSHGRLDDGPEDYLEDYLDEDPEETSEALLPDLEPVAVPAPAAPPTGPRLDREEPRDGGLGWLLAVVGAIVSAFLVLLSWTFEASD